MTIICYEPPAGIINEKDLLEDASIATMAIIEAENAMKDNSDACNEETLTKIAELVERKQAKIKELEIIFQKTVGLQDLNKKMLVSINEL